ncbi:hypothetical protein U1P98_21105 [Lysinibacillus irui]|uniref:Uncharacterized protein n=1 Tax=Lysinibacillus irui TaxID=2998077 RepID=A0AAJ5RP91_9BACI|nr:hypothetical protein [Lysinibacillus irui]MEA0553440.1 hypothetical protein [Lysinibacillus irui]MEA0978800.1 hypothetical protein [Lysinibacillus irui]MEA1044954.1 hypothetical protein [Lysinibacillus irui]WDV08685.1 hypothetical protein OU989_09485 [Lysinibacillus irui]
MSKNSYKYLKYVALLLVVFQLLYLGIPDSVKPVLVYEYIIFFGLAYLFAILQDFFNPSKKTDLLLRVALIISSIVMAVTSIYYKETFTVVFSVMMIVGISFSLHLTIKHNKKNKQKD